MALWKPSLTPGVDLRTLPLTQEEGLIASRVDGTTDLHGLSLLTGLFPDKIDAALEKLVALGAIKPAPGSAAGQSPSAGGPAIAHPPRSVSAAPPANEDDGTVESTASEGEPLEPSEDEAVHEEAGAAADAGTHRKRYETALHPLPVEQRAALAKTAQEPDLSALCFDPVPAVIQALLENPRFALPQARLVTAHHRNPVGLEAVAARAHFAADALVRKGLLHNPQLPVGLFRRLYGMRRLLEQFKLTLSRDVPEQTRRTARELLRQRFTTAPAEERVELILKTEARCMAQLTGLPVDGKTAALLCGRTYASTTMVQNLARWSSAPPALIAHLLKQDLVKRSPTLRTLLSRHPNAPSDARR